MAPSIENWTDIDGKVKSVRDVEDPAGHAVAEIDVTKAVEVKGFANLLGDSDGHSLTVHVRKGVLAERNLKVGAQVHLRVRRASPTKVYAHPDIH